MKNSYSFMKPNPNYPKENKAWHKFRDSIRAENERLIKEWDTIPWWQFWKRPSFEEQRQIIIDNWHKVERYPIPRLFL